MSKKKKLSANEVVVPLIPGFRKFTKNHLEILNKLIVNDGFPELYGEKLEKKLSWSHRMILAINEVVLDEPRAQGGRADGVNPDHDDIQANIHRKGLLLRHPPIAVFKDKNGRYIIMNGRTRLKIFVSKGVTYIIVDVYVESQWCIDNGLDVWEAVSHHTQTANSVGDPVGLTLLRDIYNEATRAVIERWIDWKTTEEGMRVITERLNSLSLNRFSTGKIAILAAKVLNEWSKKDEISTWDTDEKRATFLEGLGYVDDNKFIYVYVSGTTVNNGMLIAAKRAMQNPDKKIRVIIWAPLNGMSIEKSYRDIVNKYRNTWEGNLVALSESFFRDQSPDRKRIELFGIFPGYAKMHSLDDIVRFVDITTETPSGMAPDYNWNKHEF